MKFANLEPRFRILIMKTTPKTIPSLAALSHRPLSYLFDLVLVDFLKLLPYFKY